jgi:putative transposase
MVRTIFAQPDADTVHDQHRRIVDQLAARFPEADRAAIARLVGALLAVQNDEWTVASRRYMSVESIATALVDPESVAGAEAPALPTAA